MDRFTLDLGTGVGGESRLHVEDGKTYSTKTFDAQAIVDDAAEQRATRQGQRWGNATHVGYIPLAVYGYWARHGMLNDPKVIKDYLRQNPAFLTFEKYLK